MYKRLMRSRISVGRAPLLLEVKNNFNNYSTIYKHLTRSRILVEIASPAYLGLGIT